MKAEIVKCLKYTIKVYFRMIISFVNESNGQNRVLYFDFYLFHTKKVISRTIKFLITIQFTRHLSLTFNPKNDTLSFSGQVFQVLFYL